MMENKDQEILSQEQEITSLPENGVQNQGEPQVNKETEPMEQTETNESLNAFAQSECKDEEHTAPLPEETAQSIHHTDASAQYQPKAKRSKRGVTGILAGSFLLGGIGG